MLSHYDQDDAEDRVKLADQFVYRKKCRKQVIKQDHYDPEVIVKSLRCQSCYQCGRAVDKYGSRKSKQNYGEYAHHPFCRISEIRSRKFGDRCAFVAA